MNQMLELPEKSFKEGIIKILQKSVITSLQTNEKWEKSQQGNVSYKKKPKWKL